MMKVTPQIDLSGFPLEERNKLLLEMSQHIAKQYHQSQNQSEPQSTDTNNKYSWHQDLGYFLISRLYNRPFYKKYLYGSLTICLHSLSEEQLAFIYRMSRERSDYYNLAGIYSCTTVTGPGVYIQPEQWLNQYIQKSVDITAEQLQEAIHNQYPVQLVRIVSQAYKQMETDLEILQQQAQHIINTKNSVKFIEKTLSYANIHWDCQNRYHWSTILQNILLEIFPENKLENPNENPENSEQTSEQQMFDLYQKIQQDENLKSNFMEHMQKITETIKRKFQEKSKTSDQNLSQETAQE